MDIYAAQRFIDEIWHDEIVPELVDYIKIPNKSPHFDPDWVEHGYMEDAVKLIETWCRKQPVPGMTLEVIRLEGRTPLIFMDITCNNCRKLFWARPLPLLSSPPWRSYIMPAISTA